MRLVISRETFRLEELPAGFGRAELRGIRRISWVSEDRALLIPATDAGRVLRTLETRGVRLSDDEVRAAAADVLARDPIEAFEALTDLGDVRCLPEVARALDAFVPSGRCAICDFLVALALSSAIVVLGGLPSPAQTERLDALTAPAEAAFRTGALDAHLRDGLSTSMLLATEAARPRRAGPRARRGRGRDPASTRH